MMILQHEIVNEYICSECGGECCRIYYPDNIPPGVWFEDWCEQWENLFNDCGIDIPPLHNPLESHFCGEGGNEYRDSLPDWVDIYKCQYCHPETGCLIPRFQRPNICLFYSCEKLEKDQS